LAGKRRGEPEAFGFPFFFLISSQRGYYIGLNSDPNNIKGLEGKTGEKTPGEGEKSPPVGGGPILWGTQKVEKGLPKRADEQESRGGDTPP